MLRRRKDTQMNKIEEIMEKIDTIGREELAADGGYKISITGHSMGAALATLLGKTLVTFLCVELICAVSLLPHILYTFSSHISYPHRLLCGGLRQVCKCRSSSSSNVSIYGLVSVCMHTCVLQSSVLLHINYTDLPRRGLEPPLFYMPINYGEGW